MATSFSDIIDRAIRTGLISAEKRPALVLNLSIANTDLELDFSKLLAFDDFNFAQDICGIIQNVNRRTFKVDNCFIPRCIKTEDRKNDR